MSRVEEMRNRLLALERLFDEDFHELTDEELGEQERAVRQLGDRLSGAVRRRLYPPSRYAGC